MTETIPGETASTLDVDGRAIAIRAIPGAAPGLFWLGGFKSDMTGTKAEHLARWAQARGQANVRFDYSGHGASGGAFEESTISRWLGEALAVFDHATSGEQVVIGSSMGGWIALLLALRRPERVAGLVGIAAAPDFTETLIWPELSFEQRAALMSEGRILLPSDYGDPTPVTRALIEDGRRHLLLDTPINLQCPVRLLHGQRDPDVPWQVSLLLAERIAGEDVRLHLVKDGDHRLSRPLDLVLLETVVAGLAA